LEAVVPRAVLQQSVVATGEVVVPVRLDAVLLTGFFVIGDPIGRTAVAAVAKANVGPGVTAAFAFTERRAAAHRESREQDGKASETRNETGIHESHHAHL